MGVGREYKNQAFRYREKLCEFELNKIFPSISLNLPISGIQPITILHRAALMNYEAAM